MFDRRRKIIFCSASGITRFPSSTGDVKQNSFRMPVLTFQFGSWLLLPVRRSLTLCYQLDGSLQGFCEDFSNGGARSFLKYHWQCWHLRQTPFCVVWPCREATLIPFHSAASGWPVVHSSCPPSSLSRQTTLSLWRPLSGFYLMAYAVLFSVAYIHLDTGAGALLLLVPYSLRW